MKKKTINILMILLLALTMASCSRTKTVTDRKKAREMVEAFYDGLTQADPVTMASYSDGELMTVLTKDQDMIHVHTEYDGYDVYSFVKDGKRYTIADDGNLYEDDSTYGFYADSIDMMLKMNVTGYFDVEDDSLSFTATQKNDSEMELTIKGQQDGNEVAISSLGTKKDGKVSSIVCEIRSGETAYLSEFRFTYDEHIVLPEYTVPKTYDNMPHVESPYTTYREVIDELAEDESLFYMFAEDKLFVISEKDGRHYQLSSVVSQDLVDAFNALDFFAEDYDNQVYDLIGDLEIEDCIDFTDELVSQDELDGYSGKQVSDLLNDGFEINGYSFWEDSGFVLAQKDLMNYRFYVELPEGFDAGGEFEYDAFNDFFIQSGTFSDVEYAALPMR